MTSVPSPVAVRQEGAPQTGISAPGAGPPLDYAAFLDRKAQITTGDGFDPVWMPDFLFDFQQALVEWSLRRGRSAIFADCGLGKTPMQLVWAENVHRQTGRPVLIVTPLAVSHQTVREGAKFGIEVRRSDDGTIRPGINVTNYERLDKFNPADVAGTVCDESSAIKSFAGRRRVVVTEFMRKQQYRLLATATAAPNDWPELGTSSEALGYLGHMDMLAKFFKNDNNTIDTKGRYKGFAAPRAYRQPGWRLKGHAEDPFWRWVASWARALRRPSDFGFSDDRFVLPQLIENNHLIEARTIKQGMLFDLPARGLDDEREEQRRTIAERCEMAATLVNARNDRSIVWCNLNDEGDELERLLPGAIQVSGSDSDEWKEAAVEWFSGERCICNDRMFRAKLEAWNKNSETHGNGICESIISRTLRSSADGHKNSGTPTTQLGESATPPTPNYASASNQKSKRTELEIPMSDGLETCGSSVLPLTTMTECSENRVAGALSAEPQIQETSEQRDSMSIIATLPDESEGSCAHPAILASASSAMIPTDLTAPRCICGHVSGKRVLISKTKIFGWGLNLQCCSHMVYFPSHSFESYYQAVRRCWRFGQTKTVTVDRVTTPGGIDVMANLARKSEQADRLFSELVAHMNDSLSLDRQSTYSTEPEVPSWLSQSN